MDVGLARQKQTLKISLPSIKVSPIKVPKGAFCVGNYVLGKTIGSGSYGKVHLGLHIPTGERVAIKIIQKAKLGDKDLQHICREIDILKKVLHPSLIQLYQIIETEKSLLFVTEFMQNGQLFSYIVQRQKLKQDQSRLVFRQVMEGLEYLHNMGITHRDIKPENIMLDYDGRVKIIDFGLSNFYEKNEKLRTQCGSPCYTAPQIIQGKQKYDPVPIDVWSSGVVLFAMIAGYLPFCDSDVSKLYNKILAGNFNMPLWASQDVKDLISKMLKVNPCQRITLQQILEHPWCRQGLIKKSYGINCLLQKVPYDQSILLKIQSLGLETKKIAAQIQHNTKTKQTALYYILAKKLVKQNNIIESFIGCESFDPRLVKPWKNKIKTNDNYYDALADVQIVNPIEINLESPTTNSQDPLIMLKIAGMIGTIKYILQNFVQKQSKQISYLRREFYANNLLICKKKYQLRKQDGGNINRGKSLFEMNRKKYDFSTGKNKKPLILQCYRKNRIQKPNLLQKITDKNKRYSPSVNEKDREALKKLRMIQIYSGPNTKINLRKLVPVKAISSWIYNK